MRDDLPLRLDGVGRRYGIRGPWVPRGVDLTLTPGACALTARRSA
jgi:hypothetical protein